MKNIFSLLEVEFAKSKNKQWFNNKTKEINECITNSLYCVVFEYKYGEFREITTYVFSNKAEMEDFKNYPSGESSKWVGVYFYSDGFQCRKNIDC